MGMPLLGVRGFPKELLLQPMLESFSLEEQQHMRKGSLPSCNGEVKNICLLVRTCIKVNSDRVSEASFLVFCDNQGAVSNVNNMNGQTHILRQRLMPEADV